MYVINRVSYFKIKIFGTFLWLYILGIFFEETLRISHRISITCGSIAKVSIIIVPEIVVEKIAVIKAIRLIVMVLVKIIVISRMVEIIQILLV